MRVGFVVLVWLVPAVAHAETLYVGGAGDPHARIADALAVAVDGDVVVVREGTYEEALASQAPGVTLRGEGVVVITSPSRVLHVEHARFTVEDVVIDGMFGDADAVVIDDAAEGAALRRVEVRNASRDCIDIRGPSGVRIEQSLVHHCLASTRDGCDAADCRVDAHGIVAGPVRDLRIVDTEIHTFSGDAFQVDPGRSAPGWSDVVIEGGLFWLEPLPAAIGGFAAGVVPGENAIDTKTSDTIEAPARLSIVDTTARGFGAGLIGNMAAFNLKENVEATLDRITVHDSEIAFRLRGATSTRPRGAQVTISNAVVWNVSTAVRYEDDIAPVTLLHTTLGSGVERAFDDQSSGGTIDARNFVLLGDALPAEVAGGASNLAADAAAFRDAASHDYRPTEGGPLVDTGEMLAEVVWDRDGAPRPQGTAWDIGAFELCAGLGCPPDGGVVRRDGGTPGSDAGADASAAIDAGTGPKEDGGCGCGALGGAADSTAAALPLVLAIAASARKRRG